MDSNDTMSIAIQGAALVSLVWSCAVFLVQTIGISKMYVLPAPSCVRRCYPSLLRC